MCIIRTFGTYEYNYYSKMFSRKLHFHMYPVVFLEIIQLKEGWLGVEFMLWVSFSVWKIEKFVHIYSLRELQCCVKKVTLSCLYVNYPSVNSFFACTKIITTIILTLPLLLIMLLWICQYITKLHLWHLI